MHWALVPGRIAYLVGGLLSPLYLCMRLPKKKQNKLIHTIQGYVTYPHYLSNFLVSYGVYREGPTQLTNTCQWCVPWPDFAQIRIGKVVCVSVCAVSVSSTVDCLSINKVNYLLSVYFFFFSGVPALGEHWCRFACLLFRFLCTDWEYNHPHDFYYESYMRKRNWNHLIPYIPSDSGYQKWHLILPKPHPSSVKVVAPRSVTEYELTYYYNYDLKKKRNPRLVNCLFCLPITGGPARRVP